jgi:hypothetical protein
LPIWLYPESITTRDKRINLGLIIAHNTMKTKFITRIYGYAIPNKAANQSFSGLRKTDIIAIASAVATIRFRRRRTYIKNCFK